MRWSLLVLCILVSGCATFDPAEQIAGFDDSVEMAAYDEGVAEGRCFTQSGDGACHWVRVSVDNTGNDRDLDVGRFAWSGVGSDGGVYDHPTVEGPDKIAAGAMGSLRLGFDLSPDVRIESLRYGFANDVLLRMDVA